MGRHDPVALPALTESLGRHGSPKVAKQRTGQPLLLHEIHKFRQHDEGLCGLYTIVNALSILFPRRMTGLKGAVLVSRLAQALPGDFHLVVREGTDREQMELMLPAARKWTEEQGWPDWRWRALHPTGGKAQAFWNRVAGQLAIPGRTALLGFGDCDRPSTIYEPHWTCAERITPTFIELRDSDEYHRVRRSRTGIRPEPGWEIEDCFILERTPSPARRVAQAALSRFW
jgi:hypothetical protein